MIDDFGSLMQSFDQGIQKKQKGSFGKADIDNIYSNANNFFSKHSYVEPKRLEQIRDKWLALAEGRLDKVHAMKKLQSRGPAEAIRSVLQTLDKKIG